MHGAQHPVQRLDRVREILAGLGPGDLLEQGIDRRIGQTHNVERVVVIGRVRMIEAPQLDPRRQAGHIAPPGDVEIQLLHPFLILRVIDHTENAEHADLFEVLQERVHDPLEGGRVAEQFEFQGLSRRVAPLAVTGHGPARFVQQTRGPAQGTAVAARAIRFRRHIGVRLEHRLWQFVGERFQVTQLARGRRALGLHRPALEETVRALVEPVEQFLVRPLEVEAQRDRLAHTDVLELVAPRVEPPALRASGTPVGDLLALDRARIDRREVVAGGPDFREEFLVEAEPAALEGLEGCGAVAEILVANSLEIPASLVHGKVLGPVVIASDIGDVAPRFGDLDPVGA